eukprot:8863874-Lingulodinium_polyedra.AAC.1
MRRAVDGSTRPDVSDHPGGIPFCRGADLVRVVWGLRPAQSCLSSYRSSSFMIGTCSAIFA